MNSTLNKIKELKGIANVSALGVHIRENPSTVDIHAPKSWYEYWQFLEGSLPQLIQEHEALLRFVENVKSATGMTHPEDVENMTMEALQALDKELKG